MQNLYKKIPQVSSLLEKPEISAYLSVFYRAEIKNEIENSLNLLREKIKTQDSLEVTEKVIISDIVYRLANKPKYSLRKVINGTGTIVHTNLGRSILSKQAINNVISVSESYSNLEYDLDAGTRGSRYDHVEAMIANIVGCEAALVVNNNAAATLLAIATFSQSKDVVISRGELVEIGGSFRIPEIIELSGATLKEVGTTNRTHLKDYKKATNENTAMYLKIHPSNYRVQGFTKSVSNEEIADLAKTLNSDREQKIITMEDLGSGALIDFSNYIDLKENTVKESIKSGVDIVTFSGDKLLGGPQAGIIVGKKHLINQIKQYPLCRVLRVCKMTIAALEGTIRDYYDELTAIKSIPTLNMVFKDIKALKKQADSLSESINTSLNKQVSDVVSTNSTVGGGALPLSEINSYAVKLTLDTKPAKVIYELLKNNTIPIIGRIHDEQYLIDVRTLQENDEDIILQALKSVVDTL